MMIPETIITRGIHPKENIKVSDTESVSPPLDKDMQGKDASEGKSASHNKDNIHHHTNIAMVRNPLDCQETAEVYSQCCGDWDIDADEWWIHSPTWEVSVENSTSFVSHK